MLSIPRGATIDFSKVDHFDRLPEEEAHKILYEELVPACEAKGVMLSSNGNHAAIGQEGPYNISEYNEQKKNHTLFDVKRVQRAYASIPHIVQNASKYKTGSYGLKHFVESHPLQAEYISNGDCIAAMLLNGYSARFGKRNEEADYNCMFKVSQKE